MSKEIADEYASSLADLTVNSKPLINMLTILAEENIEHAGVIVDTVEKHLEKVHPDIKLPVLYLVDSIIKNVGGAYTQKFSQSIVNMFTRTFKQVDEKIRSQMFKLRETWHEVFPATKLYQLDVKVNLIDHAWPIQAQPQQANIHVNPNFLKKPGATTSVPSVVPTEEDERMRNILAKKEQELLMLQRKKVEMELEQTRRQLELAEKNVKKVVPVAPLVTPPAAPQLSSVVTPVIPDVPPAISVKQRLGPPVNKVGAGRIAPVSAALASARRDPRLARRAPPPAPPVPAPPAPAAPAPPPIAPNVFDIKPLERVTKRSNVITIDVRPEPRPPRPEPRPPRDPRPDPRPARDKPRREPREKPERALDEYMDRHVADPERTHKLPPIPKLPRDQPSPDPPPKRRKEPRKKHREPKEPLPSPEKRRARDRKPKPKEPAAAPEVVAFKELKNYNKERYMRRNKQKSESPEPPPEPPAEAEAPAEPANVPDMVVETKDVDLRVLHPVIAETAAPVAQKRPSTEALEGKIKKNKLDKFDILFGNEDVDLRQLPQVEELAAPPPPTITESPKADSHNNSTADENEEDLKSPVGSPKKDWHEVKEKEEAKKPPSKLDLVRAKLAEATKGKDRLGRPLLFSKSPSIEKERRRTLSSEDTDLRIENGDEFDAEDHKKTISIIMSQAKEQFNDGQLDKNQYNTLMYQVLQLNEKLKLKEAKQRESLENSKRKLKAHINEENHKVASPKSSPSEFNNFGDIDERVVPAPFMDAMPSNQDYPVDSDMRVNNQMIDGKPKVLLPFPPMPMPPMYMGPFPPAWRGPRRFRVPGPPMPQMPPFFRGKFDKRAPRPFDPRMPMMPPVLPTPKLGMCQGECPLQRYERTETPPPLGAPGVVIPPTDYRILEYIEQDPVKTIQIDGVPREIRFYGETAVIMLEWDDPREIKFLPGCRRVTFDNKDSIVISFNEGYKQVEIEDQVFEIRFGAPTRELFINGRWYECFFGGQPLGVIIDGKPRLVHLEGPPPQVDIGKVKRTDLVAGKINLIVNATQMCPVYLDAKVQKFNVNGQFFTIRFVDALRTVLINEQPFRLEFGDLPKPIFVGNEKYFIRFSALPRNIRAGQVDIEDMEGSPLPFTLAPPTADPMNLPVVAEMEVDQKPPRENKSPSPEGENQGLDLLASVMPSSLVPAASSEYSVAEPLFSKTDQIPGIEPATDDKPPDPLSVLGNINVNDLFAKLVATGIVSLPNDVKPEAKVEEKEAKEEVKAKPKEDRSVIHKVDLLKPETLRIKQPGVVARLYGGMQCSGCGARFPPEHTVRYSQHLDWHFRQNRRERDSARRAHSRHWHYDLSDWVQYEEVEDLEEREKSWFETGGAEEGEGAEAEAPPSAAAGPAAHCCALCGDRFLQFYNEDREEWHLRNAVLHDDAYYHPLCYEDYKASLTKDEPPAEPVEPEPVDIDKVEAIEIGDGDDADGEQSDNEVELVEPAPAPAPPPVEIEELDEGEEDDVVLKAEPVEQVLLDDDGDTDDETAAARRRRDDSHRLELANVRVKVEPVDPDDEPIITAEMETVYQPAAVDTTHTTVTSSIDGNVQFEGSAPPPQIPTGGIRFNISKAVPATVNAVEDRYMDDVSADDEPLPPGEEPELHYTVKPSLQGIQFSRQPPIQKGSELSGLCSIM